MLTSAIRTGSIKQFKLLYAALAVVGLTLVSLMIALGHAKAFTPNYNPSNLIDNPTFINDQTMSAGQIQAFLTSIGSGLAGLSDIEACDNTIAPYYSHCSQDISAAQIIFDASQAYDVNPRAILATLEKEQSLVTDPTPSQSQVDCAMGYNSCSGYSGFFTQVDNGTWALRYNYEGALGHANWLSWHPGPNYPCQSSSSLYSTGLYPGNSVTFYDPGGTQETETLANAATASLYCYTPYVGPYSVTGYSGSYNFVYYFQLWFGSTTVSTPYDWFHEANGAWFDSARTEPFTSGISVAPGQTFYLRVVARNTGYLTWSQANFHLGTLDPMDRSSPFYDPSTWLAPQRPAAITESSVVPGNDGTFNFTMIAPQTAGTYYEHFGVLVEGQEWLSDQNVAFQVNVTPNRSPYQYAHPVMNLGDVLHKGQYLISQDAQSVLVLMGDGNLVLFQNGAPVWNSGTSGTAADKLTLQNNGNLVLSDDSGNIYWQTNTGGQGANELELETTGNLVLYTSQFVDLWDTNTHHIPNLLQYANPSIGTGRLYPGQELDTADRHYRLYLQEDGNLVLYSSQTGALWESGTNGDPIANLVLLPNGNLELIDNNGKIYWQTHTASTGPSQLIMQGDGNLVLYGNSGVTWNTGTEGRN